MIVLNTKICNKIQNKFISEAKSLKYKFSKEIQFFCFSDNLNKLKFKTNNYKYIYTNDLITKKNKASNTLINLNKRSFSLGYRAEDLDPKPVKKNKYDNVKLSFGREARDNLLKGIKTISENVAITYGPLGKNVVIDDKDNPIVTKDGVTVAKHISLTKRKHNLGCRLLSIIAGNTNEFAGDGTTTATVLAGELSK